VNATLHAVRERFPDKRILVILELHTYSSLNKEFLPQYKNSTDGIDKVIVYYDQKAMEIKRMPELDPEFVKSAFNNKDILVSGNAIELQHMFQKYQNDYQVVLFLGSGHFGGIDLSLT
jgi:UDP-N-acetylmuramate: L-alanyl-gamma-D-glutamyl-meso-diaminopimelate ligase